MNDDILAICEEVDRRLNSKKERYQDSVEKYTEKDYWYWYLMLAEEVGEVARALLDGDINNLNYELYDIAIIVIFWLEIMRHIKNMAPSSSGLG